MARFIAQMRLNIGRKKRRFSSSEPAMGDANKETLTHNNPKAELTHLVWKAVLSSAVLSAILTLAGTWLIEGHKTNLVLQQERIQNAEKDYGRLEELLDDLSSQLADLTTTANLALKPPKEKELHDSTLASVKAVALTMTNVIRVSEGHGIDPQITKDIKETLNPLVPEMKKAQNNFENVRTICEIYDKHLKSKLDSIKAEIQKKISDMGV